MKDKAQLIESDSNQLLSDKMTLNQSENEKEQINQKVFNKAYKENVREVNLDKKMSDIKQNYEANKYDELYNKLRDAESKNEYLTNLINQLQSKRNANSAYK